MNKWWTHYPWRMVQTNLRQIDMENINAEKYSQDLKDFGASVVLLNAAGIIASYETRLPFQTKSDYLHGDSLKDMIDACHNRGIKVICRTDFSKVRYALYQEHPEWAYRTPDGDIVNYNGDVAVCPNSEYQQERKLDIIQEVLESLPFDGIFCNMGGFQVKDYSGIYYGPCHCASCTRLFREQYGEAIPAKDDPSDPVYPKYQEFKNACIAAHKEKMNSRIRKIRPDIAINQEDYIRTESNTDIGRLPWMYSASMNSRLSSGTEKTRPSDNACVDFIGYRYREVSVSPQLMELRQWQNLSNSGCLSMYIMGTLADHRDTSAFAPTKKVFRFHAAHEDLFRNMHSAAEVMLVRRNVHFTSEEPEGYGWIRALTESHIPFDEICECELTDIRKLEGKKTLILGEIANLRPDVLAIADAFAFKGGTVISAGKTGLSNGKCSLNCAGITNIIKEEHTRMSSIYEIREEDAAQFPRCCRTPLIMPGPDLVRFESAPGAKRYLRLIPEHPFGPPERCYYTEVTEDAGLSVMPFGKGKGIYLAFGAAAMYRKEGYQNTLSFLQDILFGLAGARSASPDLTPMAEITMNYSGRKLLLQLVNTSGVFGNSYFDPLPVRDITLQIPREILAPLVPDASDSCQGKFLAEALNGGTVTEELSGDHLLIRLDRLDHYEAVTVCAVQES